jgi:uncharacterized membrane protein
MRERGPLSFFLGVAGGALLTRAATNRQLTTLLGLAEDPRGIEVQKTVHIHAPLEKVFEFWSDFENFPRFMSNVRKVRALDERRSHWIVNGPAGIPVEWIAEITQFVPNKWIEWRSVPGSVVRHWGSVRFEEEGERGTRVDIRVHYVPVAGALGHAIASLFGADPKSEMDADMMRMKTMMETGHPPHDAALREAERARRAALEHRPGTTARSGPERVVSGAE